MIKRLYLVFFILCMAISAKLTADSSFVLKGGLELGGSQKYYNEGHKFGEFDIHNGYNIGLEFITEKNHYFSFGAGVMMQTNRKLDIEVPIDEEDPELKFSQLPIYGTVRICNSRNRIPRIGFVSKAGINIVLDNELFVSQVSFSPGIFLGVGGFFEFSDDFSVEGVYHYSAAAANFDGYHTTIITDSFSLLFNYRLPSLATLFE